MTEMTQLPGQRTHVVVVGGGYAGTLAANHLRQRPDVDITLINARKVFVERIRLHQLVADTSAATVDYDTLLGDGIQLVVDHADHIDSGARRVLLASGGELSYDYLIYAVGSTVPSANTTASQRTSLAAKDSSTSTPSLCSRLATERRPRLLSDGPRMPPQTRVTRRPRSASSEAVSMPVSPPPTTVMGTLYGRSASA